MGWGCHRGGVGVPPSNEIAAKWMSRAASLGFARSQYSMGIYCRDGRIIPIINDVIYIFI
jgi:TPR repeat protein